MANREPFQSVEIDVDRCSLDYGTGACLAVLGTTGSAKCFKTFKTCQYKSAYTKTFVTETFVNNRSNMPKGLKAYPVLKENGVSAISSTVNIAGSDDKSGAFGRRATISVSLQDFISDDNNFDFYANQRRTGAAQSSGVGYEPSSRGTYFTKLKARWPYYAGRPLRYKLGYLDEITGAFIVTETRNFIITGFDGPNDNGEVTFEAEDVLTLAND